MLVVFTLTTEEILDRNAEIESILGKIAEGDTQSVGVLYDFIKTDVYAYALSKTGNKADADDIMQDTFVRIFKYAKRYIPKGKPMAWIITIELNVIRRFYQINSRTVSLDAAFDLVSTDNPERTAINNQLVRQLLSNLNEDEREIVTLHIVTGLKHREIAKLLQKPLSTVLSKYNRAIKKLQWIVKEGKDA